jgi:uncharacterized membrane protein
MGFASGARGTHVARVLFALALPPVGLSHILHPDQIADLVPTWLPAHDSWAYLVGAGHMAAGVGLLLAVVPRLAVTLEAAMMSAIGILVWIPGVVTAPTVRTQWADLFATAVFAGSAWIVAGTYRNESWLSTGRFYRRLPGAGRRGSA